VSHVVAAIGRERRSAWARGSPNSAAHCPSCHPIGGPGSEDDVVECGAVRLALPPFRNAATPAADGRMRRKAHDAHRRAGHSVPTQRGPSGTCGATGRTAMDEEHGNDTTTTAPAGPGPDGVVPVIDETLQVTTRVVDTGGYRITKRVSTRDEVVDLPLAASLVEIERRRVDVLLPEGVVPTSRVEGATTIHPVFEEVVVTQKRLMLLEEIRITRVEETRHAPQTVVLRREDVVVEQLGADSAKE
jgi:uncharacterized protein (TIGR02271 family)